MERLGHISLEQPLLTDVANSPRLENIYIKNRSIYTRWFFTFQSINSFATVRRCETSYHFGTTSPKTGVAHPPWLEKNLLKIDIFKLVFHFSINQ